MDTSKITVPLELTELVGQQYNIAIIYILQNILSALNYTPLKLISTSPSWKLLKVVGAEGKATK